MDIGKGMKVIMTKNIYNNMLTEQVKFSSLLLQRFLQFLYTADPIFFPHCFFVSHIAYGKYLWEKDFLFT